MNFEFYILDLIQNIRFNFLDSAMLFITTLGNGGFIWILTGILMLCFKKTRKAGITALLALLIGFLICNILLKPLVARIRPYEIRDIIPLIPKPSDYSFPSGHSTSSFAAATALYMNFKKKSISFIVLAVLIAFSRLYLYVHFPTDIIAGIIIGILSGILSNKLTKRECKKSL